MPTIVEISKETVIKKAVGIVSTKGWNSLNARLLAKELGISTKPLYRIYKSMDEIKDDVHKEIENEYNKFITGRIDKEKALITSCVAYVEFAQRYKNLFVCLFLSNNLKWKSIENVLDEKWNQSIIINLVNKQGLSFKEAKELFINVWLYSNGLATLLATNEINISEEEILKSIVSIYEAITKWTP